MAGTQHSVEQLGSMLTARVAVADAWGHGDEILGRSHGSGTEIVVDAQQTHHLMGHTALGGQRGHGDRTTTEPGTTTRSVEANAHEFNEFSCGNHCGAPYVANLGFVTESIDGELDITPLPGFVGAGVAERMQTFEQALAPVVHGGIGSQCSGDATQLMQQFGEGAGEFDVAALEVRERRNSERSDTGTCCGHGGTHKQLIKTGLPGVSRQIGRQAEPSVIGAVEAPANIGSPSPVPDMGDSRSVETEAQTHWRAGRELQHLTGPEATVEEIEQRTSGVEQRALLTDGSVGDAHGNARHPALGIAGERGFDERRKLCDVGAQHSDIARREPR